MKFIAMGIAGFRIAVDLISSVLSAKVRFDHNAVYSVTVENSNQLDELNKIATEDYDFWTRPCLDGNTDVMVSPNRRYSFEKFLNSMNVNYTVKIANVQSLIDGERPKQRGRNFGWTDYYTLDEIYNWLDEIIEENPTILTGYNIGKSYQGRDIRAVLLSHNPENPLIVIESNIHGREWITAATSTWLLNELLSSKDPAIRDLAKNINWLIVPVLNVDGFVYTHRRNRLWRKTRKRYTRLCYGADANRNFNFKWLNKMGASSNPCSDIYAGPEPFSEPETQQWAKFVKKFKNHLKIYIAIHSYGQLLMFPYGHTKVPVDNYNTMMSIANKTADAIKVKFNTIYTVGQSSAVLYYSTGTSCDWVVNEMNGSTIAFTFELRDKGEYGMLLPANQIIPNCLEFMDGIVAMVKEARRLNQI